MEDALSTASLLVIAVLSIIFINIFLKLVTGSGFTRDEVKNPFSDSIIGGTSLLNNKDSVLSRDGVMDSIDGYEKLFNGARQKVGSTTTKESISMREKEYKTMVNSFYDLVTDFYEWGWGQVSMISSTIHMQQFNVLHASSSLLSLILQSFHFAPRRVGETFEESVLRAEYYLALRTGMDASKKVLDVGCGVGGPARNLAIFTGADITGVTINDYQVRVGNKYNALNGLHKSCR
jgi:sterol 24-C-methyltransferase